MNIFKYKWLILSGFVALCALFIIVLYNFKPDENAINPETPDLFPTPLPLSSPALPKASEIQRTTIGKTTADEVEQFPDLIGTVNNSDGSTTYSLTSPLNPRPEQIITKNGRVIFESILTPESPNAVGYASLEQYVIEYGQPEVLLQGSKFYGWNMQMYVYASKGFTLIANPYTKEIFEIHSYQPMSTDGYVKYYGDDISQNPNPPLEK